MELMAANAAINHRSCKCLAYKAAFEVFMNEFLQILHLFLQFVKIKKQDSAVIS